MENLSTSTALLLAFKLMGEPINTKENLVSEKRSFLLNISQGNTEKIVNEVNKLTAKIENLISKNNFSAAKNEITKLDKLLKTCQDKLIIFEESFNVDFSRFYKIDTITNGVVSLEENQIVAMIAHLNMLLNGTSSLEEFINDAKNIKSDDFVKPEPEEEINYFSLDCFEDKKIYWYRDGLFYAANGEVIAPLDPSSPMLSPIISSKEIKENTRLIFLKDLNKFMDENEYLALMGEIEVNDEPKVPTIEVDEPTEENEKEDDPFEFGAKTNNKPSITEDEVMRKNRLLQVRASFENILNYLKNLQMKIKFDLEENKNNLQKAKNLLQKAKGVETRQKYFDTIVKLQDFENRTKADLKRVNALIKTYKENYEIFKLEKDIMTTEDLTKLVKKMASEEANVKNVAKGEMVVNNEEDAFTM